LEQWLQDFTQEMQRLLSYSPTTAKAYASDVRRFLDSLKEHHGEPISPEDVVSDDVLNFLEDEVAAGRRRATVQRRVASLRVLERYLLLAERITRPFMPSDEQIMAAVQASAPSRTTGCLTTEDLQRLWQTLLASPKRQARRDLALVALMVEWGFPIGMLLKAQVQHVDLQDHVLWMPQTIGTLTRWELDYAYEPLRRYVLQGRADLGANADEQHLFISQQGRALSRQSVWHSLRLWGEEAGLDVILTPRLLRTTAAWRLKMNGIPAQTIGMAMGHSNPLSTTVLLRRLEQYCESVRPLELPRLRPEDDTAQ